MSQFNLAEMLKLAAEDGQDGVRFRGDYSGRGMCGRKCVGLVGHRRSVMECVGAVLKDLMAAVHEAAIDAESEEEMRAAHQARSDAERAVDQLMDISEDSMGWDTIVYWDDIQLVVENHDDLYNTDLEPDDDIGDDERDE
jgi:hypothetical protein